MSSLSSLKTQLEDLKDEKKEIDNEIDYYQALYDQITEYQSAFEDGDGYRGIFAECWESLKKVYSSKKMLDYNVSYESVDSQFNSLLFNFESHCSYLTKKIKKLKKQSKTLKDSIKDLKDEINNYDKDDE